MKYEQVPATTGLMEYELTKRMDRFSDGLYEAYGNLICLEDFKALQNQYLDPKSQNDRRANICNEMYTLLKDYGIKDVKPRQEFKYYWDIVKQYNIPAFKQVLNEMYETIRMDFVRHPFPLPEDYIQRIVDEKIDRRWENDSLRVKILKTAARDGDWLIAAGYSNLFMNDYQGAAVDNIHDGIFDIILSEKRKYQDKTAVLREKRDEKKEKRSALNKELKKIEPVTFSELKETQKDIFKKGKAELLNEIESMKAAQALNDNAGELEKKTKLLRNQIEILNRELRIIDIDIDKEKRNYRQKFKGRGKYALLTFADDLASGRFGNVNVVREELYLFAVLFGLTFSLHNGEDIEDKKHDIESVMFRDFYTNNLMRYLSDRHQNIRRGGEIQDTAGRGINYKNYMEVIFLYYLRRIDLTVPERIKGIYDMAESVYQKYQSNATERRKRNDQAEYTKYCMDKSRESLMTLETEKEFESFLVENYDCSIRPDSTMVYSIHDEQNTARKEYLKLWDEFQQIYEENELISYTIPFPYCTVEEECTGEEETDGLCVLLEKIDQDLCELKDAEKANSTDITRTDLIKLYYNYIIRQSELYGDADNFKSFQDFFGEFSQGINAYLTAAFFKPVDGRELYDMIMVYSAYCHTQMDYYNKVSKRKK